MNSILIKDTTREERELIVAESIGNISGACDGCAAGLADIYYIISTVKRKFVKSTWSFVHGMNPESKIW